MMTMWATNGTQEVSGGQRRCRRIKSKKRGWGRERGKSKQASFSFFLHWLSSTLSEWEVRWNRCQLWEREGVRLLKRLSQRDRGWRSGAGATCPQRKAASYLIRYLTYRVLFHKWHERSFTVCRAELKNYSTRVKTASRISILQLVVEQTSDPFDSRMEFGEMEERSSESWGEEFRKVRNGTGER